MPRLVVFQGNRKLMDEYVIPDHFRDDHAAKQIADRLTWAVEDAHNLAEKQRSRNAGRRRRPRPQAGYLSVDGS